MKYETNVTEFILARVAEDEAQARRYSLTNWQATDDYTVAGDPGVTGIEAEGSTAWGICRTAAKADAQFIARHDPARVLRQCEAIRRIVGMMQGMYARDEFDESGSFVLTNLAAIWADHPDYRAEWAA